MSITQITSIAGRYKKRKRIGRGPGSGHGKTSTKGHNGQNSRSGAPTLVMREGGQMPLFRRLPKRGFNNFNFAVRFKIVNVSQLEKFDDGSVVGPEQLVVAGLIDNTRQKVKILGDGDLTKSLKVQAHSFSRNAEQKITACGGNVSVLRGNAAKNEKVL
jgi:large subunit ribosomal protein L15